MKKSMLFFVFAVFNISLYSQSEEKDCLSKLLMNQKKYCRNLNKEERRYYIDLIYLAPWTRPKVLEKIKQTYGLSLCDQANFNLLETYDSPHGEIFGLIWTNDTVFFCYSIPPSLKVADHIVLTKKTYAGLDDEQKDIISGDKDWNNKIFQNKSGSPKLITPPTHYLLSTVIKTISSFDIKSITFSY